MQHGVARDAGVVDQHVDGADFLGDLGAAGLAGSEVADVPLEDRDAGLDLELLRGGVIAGVVGGDAISRILECDGNGVTDAARSSRHQGDTSHVEPPSNWSFVDLLACGGCSGLSQGRSMQMVTSDQSRSTHMAMPMPPPMHSVARPFLALRRFISCTSVVSTRAPEAPIG